MAIITTIDTTARSAQKAAKAADKLAKRVETAQLRPALYKPVTGQHGVPATAPARHLIPRSIRFAPSTVAAKVVERRADKDVVKTARQAYELSISALRASRTAEELADATKATAKAVQAKLAALPGSSDAGSVARATLAAANNARPSETKLGEGRGKAWLAAAEANEAVAEVGKTLSVELRPTSKVAKARDAAAKGVGTGAEAVMATTSVSWLGSLFETPEQKSARAARVLVGLGLQGVAAVIARRVI